jgi:hypothetical protein
MAENSSNHIDYILAIDQKHREFLGNIRHWNNLKMASNEGMIWIKNITSKQVESIEIKSIPYKQIYYIKENKLFPYGSNLPALNAPSLLWTPIEVGLTIKLPKQNHNYFGVGVTINMHILQSENVYEPFALITNVKSLNGYIETAPAIRLKNLSWTILDQSKVLILGTPILPIEGTTYWNKNNFLIPTGYDFEMHLLTNALSSKINQKSSWIIWNTNSTYSEVPHNSCKPLNISSFRLSKSFMELTQV